MKKEIKKILDVFYIANKVTFDLRVSLSAEFEGSVNGPRQMLTPERTPGPPEFWFWSDALVSRGQTVSRK